MEINKTGLFISISRKEYFINISAIVIIVLVIGKLFYGTFLAGIIIMPISVPLLRQRKKKIYEKKITNMEAQFKDMLISISDAMSTGYSVENAIRESYRDLLPMYGYDSIICREQRLMISRINLHVNVETVMEEFSKRSNLKNAKMFYEVFAVAKRTGGNMTEVIKNVTDNIVLKEAVKSEIKVAINSKKLEQKIMTAIPLFIIVYVSLSSPGFLNVMYEDMIGKIIMTVCLIGYVGAFMWAEKIVKIRV